MCVEEVTGPVTGGVCRRNVCLTVRRSLRTVKLTVSTEDDARLLPVAKHLLFQLQAIAAGQGVLRQRLDRLADRFGRLETRGAQLRHRFAEIGETVESIDHRLASIGHRLEHIEAYRK
jgi:hypothetical protein